MLTKQETTCYRIAMAANEHMLLVSDNCVYEVCPVCNGSGLLAHPLQYMNVAPCYMCDGSALIKSGLIKRHANTKAIPA